MAYYTKVGDYTPGTRARGTEIETEFDTIEDGFDKVALVVDENGALGKDLTGGAAYQLTGMVDGVNAQDYATIANVNAAVSGGGTPGSIPITSLGVGTATADQFVMINSGGTAVIGEAGSTVADSIPVTSLGVGTATSSQTLQINSAGTAVVGTTAPVEFVYPSGYFSGLELNSYDLGDKRHDMRLEVGECLDEDGDEIITVSSTITKQFDVAWVEGAGGGAGAVLPSSAGTGTYYFFLITKDADGTVDWFGDTSSSGANVPSNWSIRRQLGSWPYLNVAGGSMGWQDGGARRQFGNLVMQGVNTRGIQVLVDSSISSTDESFTFNSFIDSNEASIVHGQFTLWNNGNTTIAATLGYGYNSNQLAGAANGLKTGICAAGDNIYSQVHEQLYNKGTTFWYGTSGAAASYSFYVGIMAYDNMREVNY